jgi:hypothetical protein
MTMIYCPRGNRYLYNQTFSASNTATCIKDDVTCDFHTDACYGKVSCLGEGPNKCCVANYGITGQCDGSSEGQKEYTIENDSTCYFKKGQKKTTYFQACESICSIEPLPPLVAMPPSAQVVAPTGFPTALPSFVDDQLRM